MSLFPRCPHASEVRDYGTFVRCLDCGDFIRKPTRADAMRTILAKDLPTREEILAVVRYLAEGGAEG